MATVCNIHLLAHDFAANFSTAKLKDKFFFGSNDNIRVVWDYCILCNLEIDRDSEELDASDLMHLDILDKLQDFYKNYSTLPTSQDNAIMDVFRFFCARGMIL